MIRTVDTDVVVLAIALFCELNVTELWIESGSGQNQENLAVHTICSTRGPNKSKGFCSSMPSQDVTRLRFCKLQEKSA